MSRFTRWTALVAGSVALLGCDGRYAYFREPRRSLDRIDTERSATWIGSRAGEAWLVVAAGASLERDGGLAVARVERVGWVRLSIGTYRYDGRERLEIAVETRHTWNRGARGAFLDRPGAARTEILPPEVEVWSAVGDGDRLTLTPPRGEPVSLRPLGEVLSRFDPGDPRDAITVFRLLMLPLVVGLARIPGFDSLGMDEYVADPADPFPGLLRGSIRLRVTPDVVVPEFDVSFSDAVDATDLAIEGRYGQRVNLAGRGELRGSLRFSHEDEATAPLTAIVDLAGVEVRDGVPSRGFFALLSGDAGWAIPSGAFVDLDLSVLEAPR